MKYRILLEQDENGVFVAQVPSLPGCLSQGKTRKEALKNIQEAVVVYLESLQAHNEPIPPSIYEEIVEVVL
ncbi:MAG: type II toxin-antitoxin system HicB family antitoxin [Candidatus Parabeggiatoa sp.]|nr:type II toxin-antitoxin system HicB family antitoxin [Candidatus Parabeggiatoa sp.]